MQENDAQRLLEKYRNGECTEAELIRLRNWFHTLNQDQQTGLSREELETAGSQMWAYLDERTRPKVRSLWPRYTAAAAVLVMISAAAYIFLIKTPKASQTHTDVRPYTAQAILKHGGRTILLDKTANGKIAATPITKSTGEQLAYTANTNNLTNTAAVYDTITIPAGGRPYTVQLTDGSRITLNAATTLRYPETFSKDRKEQIELISGEIYADIVHNAQAPLTIQAPGQVIHDIGTSLDIQAYPDEQVQATTLVEGKLTVNNIPLNQPAQQVLNGELSKKLADLSQVTAWKDGDFNFNNDHIDVIMRQIARWYNVQVSYEGKMTTEVFTGRITRKKNLSEVLALLERTQKIRFKIEGRRVTVLNKK